MFSVFAGVGALLLAMSGGPAHAILAGVSTNPDTTVQVNPANGYPVWYQDAAGVALEQCNFGIPGDVGFVEDPLCIQAGAAEVSDFVSFEEAFWWAAGASAANAGIDGRLDLAQEAAFATGDPVEGQQIVFARIRIRVDVPTTGTYTVVHPYGTKVYNIAAVGSGNEINDTVDIGGGPLDFVTALGGGIGPFLACVTPAPPAGYLGDFGVPCTVTGSPFDTNVFSITGPGGITATTDQFSISGKLFTGVVPLPSTVDRTTYRCTTTGTCTVDVFAHSTTGATLVAAVPPANPSPVAMTADGAGAFFVSIPVNRNQLPVPVDPVSSPALQVAVTASQQGFTDVTIQRPVVDLVDITKAEYNMSTGIIAIEATSSDALASLNEGEFGQLTDGVLYKDLNGATTVNAPPAQVNIVSNGGGVATKLVTLVDEPEVLSITRKAYVASQKRYILRGTSSAIGTTVTATLSNGTNDGAEIGAATVGTDGVWVINRTVAQGAPERGGATLVDIVSTAGQSKLNKSLAIQP
jgi:hypothetical protein